MNKMQKQVEEFMTRFDQVVRVNPIGDISSSESFLRVELIAEEFRELRSGISVGSVVDIADALADLTYVVIGTASTYGIDLEPVFDEVHRSNMTKIWDDGSIRRSVSGKILKPPTYSRADIAGVLGVEVPTNHDDDFVGEIWHGIPGFDNYEISTLGRILNRTSGEYLTGHRLYGDRPAAIRQVGLYKDRKIHKFFLHRLVAFVFMPQFNQKIHQISFIDPNLDSRLSNLKIRNPQRTS